LLVYWKSITAKALFKGTVPRKSKWDYATAFTIEFSNNFKKWKSYAKRQCYTKKLKMHAVSMPPHARCMWCHWHRIKNMTPHARLTNDSNGPGSFKGNIYQKHILYVPELSYPTPKKYINLKGLPNKKFREWEFVSLTQHARFLRSKIDHISANSKQNSKSPWIRGPGGIVWWKTEGRKSPDTVPLIPYCLNSKLLEIGLIIKEICWVSWKNTENSNNKNVVNRPFEQKSCFWSSVYGSP
jgi:hypothetical protein